MGSSVEDSSLFFFGFGGCLCTFRILGWILWCFWDVGANLRLPFRVAAFLWNWTNSCNPVAFFARGFKIRVCRFGFQCCSMELWLVLGPGAFNF